MKKIAAVFAVLSALLMTPANGRAAESRQGSWQAGGGVGLAFHSPVRFDLNLNGEYFFTHHVSFGLNVDFLFRGPTTFVFQPFARYNIDLDFAPGWVPFVGGGLGVGVNTNGNGFMDIMVPDFGFRYEIIDNKLFIGPDLSLHIVTNFTNTTWDFRMLIAQAEFRF